jgi:hypothetical protein
LALHGYAGQLKELTEHILASSVIRTDSVVSFRSELRSGFLLVVAWAAGRHEQRGRANKTENPDAIASWRKTKKQKPRFPARLPVVQQTPLGQQQQNYLTSTVVRVKRGNPYLTTTILFVPT